MQRLIDQRCFAFLTQLDAHAEHQLALGRRRSLQGLAGNATVNCPQAFTLTVPSGNLNTTCAAGQPTTADSALALSLSLLTAMERINRDFIANITASQTIMNGLDDAFQIKDDEYESRFVGMSTASNIYFSYLDQAASKPPC